MTDNDEGRPSRKTKRLRKTKVFLLVLFVAAIGVQFVPYGRDHSNPQTTAEPRWDSPETARLAKAACYDCHSNQTEWPWYSHIAPFSWLVQYDVEKAREHLNFTEWNEAQDDADEAPEEVEEGNMPLSYYVWLHPEADLSPAARKKLVQGLKATTEGRPVADRHAPEEDEGDDDH